VLESLGISLEDVRAQVGRIIGSGEEVQAGQIPFTPRAKRVLELALREAMSLEHTHIGTEHILLGLARENEGVASRILLDSDIDAEAIRAAVGRTLGVSLPRPIPVSKGRPLGATSMRAIAGALLVASSLGVGILIGWLVWGY
jgi:ATP-dependent Clp protease ATP-binding subunit ClpC